jgi:hypothetical protein
MNSRWYHHLLRGEGLGVQTSMVKINACATAGREEGKGTTREKITPTLVHGSSMVLVCSQDIKTIRIWRKE